MQLFQQPFDARTVKPNEAFEPLPEAWYIANIANSEAKPTKDNESGYLQLELEVIDGDHKGRKVFDLLNLWNKSVQATEIAHRQLSAYCHATGVFVLQDSAQLHGIPFKVKLGIRKDEGYEARNIVKAVKHIQDPTPTTQAAPSTPAVPFGLNPSLPPQAPVAATPPNTLVPSVPVQQASAPPWGIAPMQPQGQQPAAPAWSPPAPQQATQPIPAAGPVPPWRK